MKMRYLNFMGFFVFLLLWSGDTAVAQDQNRKPFVRQSLHEFVKDRNKLISLIRGVLVMKSRNNAPKDSAEYRTSWEYWANIHGYPGTGPRAGFGRDGLRTVAEVREAVRQSSPEAGATLDVLEGFYAGMKDFTPPDTMANEVWATCEHGTDHFFTWHRMYLYFFERVLREASGDPAFALPYWDYTNNTTDAANPGNDPWRVPNIFSVAQLRGETGPIPNPLFEARRTGGFGSTVQVNLETTNIDSVLKIEKFSDIQGDDDVGFQATLDGGLHGHIHCLAGNSCLAPFMGLVPFSGNDPIFYHHHANIDRLWECWTTRNGQAANPVNNDAWMKQSFTFVDENGAKVTMAVSDLFDPKGRIDYTYDNATKCFRVDPSPVQRMLVAERSASPMAAAESKPAAVATANNVRIDLVTQEVALAPPATPSAAGAREAFRSVVRPNALGPGKAIFKIQGLQVDKMPGASIEIYLTDRGNERREFVGVVSFFSNLLGGHHGAAASKGKSYSFDVSDQLQRLLADRDPNEGVKVIFVASNGQTGGSPVNRAQYEAAGIRIKEMQLQVESKTVPLKLR